MAACARAGTIWKSNQKQKASRRRTLGAAVFFFSVSFSRSMRALAPSLRCFSSESNLGGPITTRGCRQEKETRIKRRAWCRESARAPDGKERAKKTSGCERRREAGAKGRFLFPFFSFLPLGHHHLLSPLFPSSSSSPLHKIPILYTGRGPAPDVQ